MTLIEQKGKRILLKIIKLGKLASVLRLLNIAIFLYILKQIIDFKQNAKMFRKKIQYIYIYVSYDSD